MYWRLLGYINYVRKKGANVFFRKRKSLNPDVGPVISFTFDDFPISAASEGANILEKYGARATFYASMSNLDKPGFFRTCDLEELFCKGHEIGCHTFSHIDCWKENPLRLLEDVKMNQLALQAVIPQSRFTTFAYPYAHVPIIGKLIVGAKFNAARGGKGGINCEYVDANSLLAHTLFYNLNQKNLVELISNVASCKGWLIFIIHDVGEEPSTYGCTPAQLEMAVRLATQLKIRIL